MKTVWAFLCTLLLLVIAPHVSEAKQFPDVNKNSELGRAIDYLSDEGIIRGFPDGTFRPFERVTRGQAAKMIAELTYVQAPHRYNTSLRPSFKDIPNSHQYFEAIEGLASYEVIGGFSDGTFRPGQHVTRAHTAKMIAYGFVLYHHKERRTFLDVDKHLERYEYINSVYQTRIMRETKTQTFSPNQYVTRGEMALFLFRAHNYSETMLKEAKKKNQPFIPASSTLGKALKNHPVMGETILRLQPISSARYDFETAHYAEPSVNQCSHFKSLLLKLCYGEGFKDGQAGIDTVEIIDTNLTVNTIKNAVNAKFTVKQQRHNGQTYYRGFAQAGDLHYYFEAIGAQENQAIAHQLVVSTKVVKYRYYDTALR